MRTATEQFAEFATTTDFSAVPETTRRQAKRTLLNFFGCACGGARHPSIESVLDARRAWSGPASSLVIGRGERVDPFLAALANGMSSAVYSFDDTHAQALVHPGGPVAASLLALCETRPEIDGRRFLLAFVVGVEIVCRLSKSVATPPAAPLPIWVLTGVCAGMGAAGACAAALGLTPREAASAIGIALTRASGLRGLSHSGCFAYMAGSAAESGLNAAFFAQAGLIGPDEPLDGGAGFCAAFAAAPHAAYLTSKLGVSYELDQNTFKPYPCGVVIHPVIDACLALAQRIADADAIEEIVIAAPSATKALSDKPDPCDQYEAQVSLQHWAACAFLDREAGVNQSDAKRLHAPDVIAMRRRIRVEVDEELSRTGARASVRLRSGESLSYAVADCRGSLRRPLTDAELGEKFMRQAAPALGGRAAQRLAEACWRVESLSSAAALAK